MLQSNTFVVDVKSDYGQVGSETCRRAYFCNLDRCATAAACPVLPESASGFDLFLHSLYEGANWNVEEYLRT